VGCLSIISLPDEELNFWKCHCRSLHPTSCKHWHNYSWTERAKTITYFLQDLTGWTPVGFRAARTSLGSVNAAWDTQSTSGYRKAFFNASKHHDPNPTAGCMKAPFNVTVRRVGLIRQCEEGHSRHSTSLTYAQLYKYPIMYCSTARNTANLKVYDWWVSHWLGQSTEGTTGSSVPKHSDLETSHYCLEVYKCHMLY